MPDKHAHWRTTACGISMAQRFLVPRAVAFGSSAAWTSFNDHLAAALAAIEAQWLSNCQLQGACHIVGNVLNGLKWLCPCQEQASWLGWHITLVRVAVQTPGR
jgi:hypothetical protein